MAAAILAVCPVLETAQAATAVDLASEAGLPPPLPSNGESVVFDYDGDGDQDILLSGHGQEWPLLQQGPSGFFARALPGSFAAAQDRHGCTTGDYNRDGMPDLYCVRGACKGVCVKNYPNELYLQRPDRTFEKIAGAWGADDPHGRGRGALTLDFDQDGDSDLLVLNEKSTAFPSNGNHLYRNEGGSFVEVVGTPLSHTIGSFRAVAIRKPGGYPDVAMVTPNAVLYYKNNRGTFAAGVNLGGKKVYDVDAADLDRNGRLDLVIVQEKSVEVRLNDGTFSFSSVTFKKALTQGRDVALCDLDNRAGLDLYVVQGVRPANQDVLLLNNGTGKKFNETPLPRAEKGHGDVATCVNQFPGRKYPGALGMAVLVTNGKWLSAENPEVVGPARLMVLKP
ncbi:MAG: FG-GAP repeat domain-containing protein [Geminicoccaceae bacterium]